MKPFLAILVFLIVTPAVADAGETRSSKIDAVMQNIITEFIRPRYEELNQKALILEGAVTTPCATPSAGSLEAAKNAFTTTAVAWSGVEILRFGPVAQDNLHERILFYPDRKGLGLRQVQRILAEQDETVSSLETLQIKSVAVQGLGAMEFLLFGTGSDELTNHDRFRCAYASTIASNLVRLARVINEGWRDGSLAAQTWTKPGPDNPVLRTSDEAVNEVLGTLVHGLEAVKDLRIGSFLKSEARKDRPKAALFRRSENTLNMIAGNISSARRLLEAADLKSLLSTEDAALIDNVLFDLRKAERATRSLTGPIANILSDPKTRTKLEYVRTSIGFAIRTLDEDVARAAGLSSGFSFSDGD